MSGRGGGGGGFKDLTRGELWNVRLFLVPKDCPS